MKSRVTKLTNANTATARQPAAGHQLAPQQIRQAPQSSYGRGMPEYSQGPPQVSWQQPVITQGYQQPPQTPSRQFQQKNHFGSQPHTEQMDGAPQVIHHGKIQMKDAITLITLRLAKLEEMTSTPGFHSAMNGSVGGSDVDGDNVSAEIIESINERLGGLEQSVGLLFERTSDLHSQLEEMKVSIQLLVDGSSIDHNDLIIQPSQLQDDTVDVFQNSSTQQSSVPLSTQSLTITTDECEEEEEESTDL
jgi:hypothetical protein